MSFRNTIRFNWFRDMEILGFTIFGSPKPIIIYYKFEVKEMCIIDKTLIDCIFEDLLDICQEDLKKKDNNKAPEKFIKEIAGWYIK